MTVGTGQILDLTLRGVPLLSNGEVRGAYLIYEDVSEQIRAAEAQRQHAESLNQLVKELELRTKQMTALNDMGSLLECSGTVKEACAVVAESIEKLFPKVGSGAFYLFKSSRNLVESVLRWGTTASISEPTFSPDACWSLRRGQPHWSEHPGTGISCRHLAESATTECLCVPMVAQGNTIGILHLEVGGVAELQQVPGNENFRDSHQRLAISVASQIALSLASLQLRETLREQSIRDPLTGLFNRRFLEESLERELQLASRKKQSLAVLFLDLDHFKRFTPGPSDRRLAIGTAVPRRLISRFLSCHRFVLPLWRRGIRDYLGRSIFATGGDPCRCVALRGKEPAIAV